MTIQYFPPSRRFLNLLHPMHPYHKLIITSTGYIGFHIGKTIARYIRDHNFNWLAQSNWASIRNTYRVYRYLFPENSTRKYFMEVAIPDHLLAALVIETHLQIYFRVLPPLADEPIRDCMEEVCIAITRVFFFVYGINKIQQWAYEIIRHIPHRYAFPIAVSLAPTGTYRKTFPNGAYIERRN